MFALVLILSGFAPAQEKKIKREDLPPEVQKALQKASGGATIVGFAKETEGGAVRYEVEMKAGNHSKDVTFDADGNVVAVEEETTLDSIPAGAREAILKTAGKQKLLKIESVTEAGATTYEAHFKSGLRTKEVKVDAGGKPVK
jgi:uncharacterized membrane protein YkoI